MAGWKKPKKSEWIVKKKQTNMYYIYWAIMLHAT